MNSSELRTADTSVRLYFAYGSNLHPLRLADRLSTVVVEGIGSVPGRRLAFHKHGKDGSGKCDAARAGESERVFGALFVLGPIQWQKLCRIEGVGAGYESRPVSVDTEAGRVSALTFIAQPEHVDPALSPFDWYRALVVEGARSHGFPNDYIERIDGVHSVADPDSKRAASNWSLVERIRASGQHLPPADDIP